MSSYKTPIRIHVNSTRKVNERVTKYRLPFKKDQPSEDKQYSLNQLENQTFKIQAHPKQKNHKGDSLTLSRYEQKYGKASQKQDNDSKERSIKEEQDLENNIPSSEVEQNTPLVLKGQESASKNNKTSIDQFQQSQESLSRNNLQRISSIKPRIFHEEPQEKQRYHSAVSQYEEEINFADRSMHSDQEISYEVSRKPRVPSSERKEETDTPLPLIRPQRGRVLHSSLKKDEHKSIWNTLSDEIEEYRSQSMKKQQKRKRRSSQFKMSKQLSKVSPSDNECLAIESQLKMLNKNHNNLNLHSKEDFYVNLPAIPEDTHEQEKMNKKQRGIIERLKMDIQLQQQNKKSKLKYPLQHYVENYYKIRQINPFFRKLNELGGCIMLSIGKLKVYESGHQIYTEGQPLTHIYVNIVGKIFLSNMHKSFKKFALTGQTLGEQALFEEGKPYHDRLQRGSRPMFHKEEARTISRVCLLRIKLKKYYKMANQLYSIGYKNMFNLIDNLFRINYHKKQSLRQGLKKDRLQTQILLSRNYRPSSQFFY